MNKYACIHVYMYTHIYAHSYKYLHIHTHMQNLGVDRGYVMTASRIAAMAASKIAVAHFVTGTHHVAVLTCVAVCCGVLRCVAVCCSLLQWFVVCCSAVTASRTTVCCSVLQCVAVSCSVLQCIIACYATLTLLHQRALCLREKALYPHKRIQRISTAAIPLCVCVCVRMFFGGGCM